MPSSTPDYGTSLEYTFALGSSQYASIFTSYLEFVENREKYSIGFTQDKFIDFLSEATDLLEMSIKQTAEEYDEEPNLEEWYKLDLLTILLRKRDRNDSEQKELSKRAFAGLFQIMKNQSWDLWGALKACHSLYPELTDVASRYRIELNEDDNNPLGFELFFFAEQLNLSEKEVKDIFGDFDT